MTFREFTGKNVEEAIRTAMKEFGADLGDLDIEILAQGSRGILGVGGEEARILAAPKSAVASSASVLAPPTAPQAPVEDEPAPAPRGRGRGRAARAEAAPVAPVEEQPAEPEAPAMAAEDAPAEIEELPEAMPAEPDAAGEPAAFAVGETEGRDDGSPRRRGRRGGRGRNGRDAEGGPPRERSSREPTPFVPAKPLEELSEEERTTLVEAQAVLTEILRLMEINATVEIALGHETSKLNVKGDGLGVLIGRRGEKLASLQHIVNLMVSRRDGPQHRIMVDVENYRGRREDQLRDVAERAAKRVIQTGKIIQLEAMPAVERRIVHMALVENPKIRTQSVGVEPNRRIVILPATQVEPR
ncbi:MAG TPA: RNA-binding cell elongation regulator Jag/EloR [Candidatus Limnocylindria bacterium]|nr:RNA-binding cell elongation regulator Jag/EloR [Candidatus Limnocylindria bacterium]